jgi:hypothetical protein
MITLFLTLVNTMDTLLFCKALLFYTGLSVLWYASEPAIWLKRLGGFKEEMYDSYGAVKKAFLRLFYCLYCSSVWITIILTQDLFLTVCVSLIAFILDKF